MLLSYWHIRQNKELIDWLIISSTSAVVIDQAGADETATGTTSQELDTGVLATKSSSSETTDEDDSLGILLMIENLIYQAAWEKKPLKL